MSAGPDEFELGCHGVHSTPGNTRRRPRHRLSNAAREAVVWAAELAGAVRHVAGPARPVLGPRDLVVLCIGRDATTWIGEFIEHHLTLGAAHIVYLDNGSVDDTVAIAKREPRVTVYSTGLPFGPTEVGMRRWLTRRFAWQRWSLYCDVDELFDYPCSDRLPLSGLLGYLEQHGYKALTGQMLDLFSSRTFRELADEPAVPLRQRYRFYDLSHLRRVREVHWIRDGATDNPEIAAHFGGVRHRFFRDPCLLLTKHPLVFADRSVGLYSYDGHFMARTPVADITAALLHFKYVANLPRRARKSMEWVSPGLYGDLAEVLEGDPDLTLMTDDARELKRVDELVDNGFLVVTDQYRRWVEAHGR